MQRSKFSEFLEKKFLEWQMQQGRRITLREFAEHVGVSRAAVSLWMNGDRTPEEANLQKLAQTLGPEIYDLLELPRPDPYLQKINRLWERIPPEKQQQLAKDAEKYEAEALKNDGSKNSHKQRKTASH